jgi:hypothetical protein
MYRAGTGDCFLLKFYAGRARKFTMMIDGGVIHGGKEYLSSFADNIKQATDGKLDLLVITHEHKDHVYMFEQCKEVFKSFEIEELWMGWTEEDGEKTVEDWKKKYGEKKKALSIAAQKLKGIVDNNSLFNSLAGNHHANAMYDARLNFVDVLNGFSDLHVSADDPDMLYKGALKGMHVVKNELNIKKVRYCKQGDIIKNLNNLDGIKFYVLGPPNLHEEVKIERSKDGGSYDHNKDLEDHDLFALSILKDPNGPLTDAVLPFDRNFLVENDFLEKETDPVLLPNTEIVYENINEQWRKIDHEWIFSAGNLALRMNGLTNNLSLVLAIEFEESKKVMLFPGDAEFGSWESWHNIKWKEKGENDIHLTEDLLNRTVFYKVAHHLSHNGTAKEIGLEMMNHEDLVAMATLDYNSIHSGWKKTMPNRAIVKELLKRTKGRLIIMNEENVFYDLNDKIPIRDKIEEAQKMMNDEEAEEFIKKDFDIPKPKKVYNSKTKKKEDKILFYEYSVDGKI